jgi:hypothetical protein
MRENRSFAVWARLFAGLFALAGLLGLAGCGGGSGAPNNPFNTPGDLVVNPPLLTAYAETPTTVTIAGGQPPYTIVSSDQTALPVPFNVSGSSLTVVPNNVSTVTAVTLTARDAFGASAQSDVTINPAPLVNSLKLKADQYLSDCPNSGGSANPADDQGSTFICGGQTGSLAVRVANGVGGGLSGRLIRFDVVQGSFQIDTELPGQPVTTALTYTVPSDQNGNAVVRIRVAPNAPGQIAIVQATDVSTGSFVRGTFVIVAVTNANATDLVIVPTDVNITGADNQTCSTGVASTYYIFGGAPPYTIVNSFPQTVLISPSVVTTSGAGFTVTTLGFCVDPLNIAITDSAGHTVTVTLHNVVGTATPASTTARVGIILTPSSFPAGSPLLCGSSTSLVATGGGFTTQTGTTVTYTPPTAFLTSTSRPNVVSALPASAAPGSGITLTRVIPPAPSGPPGAVAVSVVNPGDADNATENITITVSDGTTIKTVTLPVINKCTSPPAA